MLTITVTVDTDILDAIAETARQSPRRMQTAYHRATVRLRKRLLDALQAEPGAPSYPIRWKSQRQKRAVLRKLRLAGNLPYQRSHALVKQWKVALLSDGTGGILEATNASPYVDWVQGDFTQPFHLDTGWPQAGALLSKYRVEAEEVLIQTWFTINDDLAGVR